MTNRHDYQTLELLIGAATPAGYPLTITQSPAGEATALCGLNPADGELQDALGAVAARNVDADFLNQIGAFLFEELFVGEIGEIYRTSLGIARGQRMRLRVRLRIEPPELAALPWEFLYDSQEEQSFAISSEIALVRYVPMRLPVRPSTVTLPLRLLVVLAGPVDLPGLDVATERRHIEEALQERIDKGEVQVIFLEAATVANIQQALRTVQPHVFHFVGHGNFDGAHAQLMLKDEQGRSAPVDERAFRELFAGSSETRAAVLNACQTGSTSTVEPLVGLAPRLLQRQLSAVVAMQYAITDQAGLIFAREFYRSLAVGLPIDAAIDEARRGIWLELGADQPDWAAPALFMRATDGQLFAVEQASPTAAVMPPPEPISLPDTSNFVGRETELHYYTEQLTQHHLAVIVGMPGVGKTSLAAQLAQQFAQPEKTFWYSFRPEEGLEILVWKVAAFLAWRAQPALWELLQGSSQRGNQLPPLDVLLDYLFQLLRGQGYVVCLDDFHYVDQDPLMEPFTDRLTPLLRHGDLTLVITSSRLPGFARDLGVQPLGGLSRIDMARLLTARNLVLPDGLTSDLYRYTEGNAEFLTIAMSALARAKEPALLIARLTHAENIQYYLLNQLDVTLTADERQVESTVALLATPSTRDAIEATAAADNLHHPLHTLSNRYLLTVWEEVLARKYGQHTILRAFYYELLSRHQRQAMHQRAAVYYEVDEGDPLRAAQHHLLGGDPERAATVVLPTLHSLLNQGEARPLAGLLLQVTAANLPPLLQAQVQAALGEIFSFLRDGRATEHLHTALTLLQTLEQSAAVVRRQIAVYRLMAELRQGQAPADALQWVARGLALTTEMPACEEAIHLYITAGNVHRLLAQYPDALQLLGRAAEVTPALPPHLQAHRLAYRGVVYWELGDFAQAATDWQAALNLYAVTKDEYQVIHMRGKLALAHQELGEWGATEASLLDLLVRAGRIGDRLVEANTLNNLGWIYKDRGQDEQALAMLHQSLDLARNHASLAENELYTLCNLADLHLRRREADAAQPFLERATELANALQIQPLRAYLECFWAQFHLHNGDLAAAQVAGETGLAQARALQIAQIMGVCLRVQGQVRWAQGYIAEAIALLDESLAVLADQEPFEHARTQLIYGELLLTKLPPNMQIADGPPTAVGRNYLHAARATFTRLAAQRELTWIETL